MDNIYMNQDQRLSSALPPIGRTTVKTLAPEVVVVVEEEEETPYFYFTVINKPTPPPKPAANTTSSRFRRGLKAAGWNSLKDFTPEELESRPLFHPQPPPPPAPPLPAATKPVVVKHAAYYDSPGSRIPRWVGLRGQSEKLRPVQAVVQPIVNMAAHSEKDKPARQVERARRKPKNIRAAPQARVESGQGVVGQPLVLPALTREDPLKWPEEALGHAFALLQDEEWERKTEGLRLVRALAAHHSEVVLPELHDICTAVIAEVKNLRSIVSRDAITTMAHLFTHLQQDMDREVEGAARTLLHKAGDTSLFIKEGVELALSTMVHSCSPGRVLRALLAGGFRHRNAATRAATSLNLMRLIQKEGACRVLNGRKQFISRLVPAISTLAFDSAQEVRLHARAALRILGSNLEDSVKMIHKYVQLKDQESVKKLLCK